MLYDSLTLARYILALAKKRKGYYLNMTQVQKLLYIVYGYMLAKQNRLVVSDDSPRAWPYGPVFPRVHKKLDVTERKYPDDEAFIDITQDPDLRKVIENVVDTFSEFSGSKLSAWSHTEGGPWDKTTKQKDFNWNAAIPIEFILEYFKKEL